MTIYDMSFTNSTNPVGLIIGINDQTGGLVGMGICLVIYFIVLVGALNHRYGIGKALLATSFILGVISGILLSMQILPDYILGVNMAIFVASIFLTIFGNK